MVSHHNRPHNQLITLCHAANVLQSDSNDTFAHLFACTTKHSGERNHLCNLSSCHQDMAAMLEALIKKANEKSFVDYHQHGSDDEHASGPSTNLKKV